MAYHHIIVPVDGSRTSLKAVSQAAEIAKAFGSKVTALCVIAIDPFVGVEFVDTRQIAEEYANKAREGVQTLLEETKQKFAEYGVDVDTQIIQGHVVHSEIVRAVETLNADLVVMGSHGRKGFKKMMLGSVAQNLLGEIHVPVLVVRD